MTYKCFTRDWWIDNYSDGWPNNLEPFGAGEKTNRASFKTEAEAQQFAKKWNDTHDAGRYSNRCEYEKEISK